MAGSKSRQLIKRSWGLTIVGLGLLGCSYLGQSDSQPGITLIQEIQFNGQSELSVHLQGTVGDRVPLLNSEVYELQDETGVIWVLTPARCDVFALKSRAKSSTCKLDIASDSIQAQPND